MGSLILWEARDIIHSIKPGTGSSGDKGLQAPGPPPPNCGTVNIEIGGVPGLAAELPGSDRVGITGMVLGHQYYLHGSQGSKPWTRQQAGEPIEAEEIEQALLGVEEGQECSQNFSSEAPSSEELMARCMGRVERAQISHHKANAGKPLGKDWLMDQGSMDLAPRSSPENLED
ncbi:hypothetical protein H920_20358 [Fukomys damarensis]|uniref:Uncharacterized protein n=1 Tax=Fukomys damarensis TaxID=885580 RepID=A0A091CMN1_FUKDA|nr:hypothetical protein H920_20358 [Fukomys damarensis]